MKRWCCSGEPLNWTPSIRLPWECCSPATPTGSRSAWLAIRTRSTRRLPPLSEMPFEWDATTPRHLRTIAWAVAYVLRDLAIARKHMDRALELNRNDSSAWAHSGWINLWWGSPAVAVEHLGRAVRHDPWHLPLRRNAMAHAYLFLDKHEEALGCAESQLRDNPDTFPSLCVASASAAFAGMADLALKYGAHLQAIDPNFRVSRLEDYLGPYRLAEFPEKYRTGLRMAGLPE